MKMLVKTRNNYDAVRQGLETIRRNILTLISNGLVNMTYRQQEEYWKKIAEYNKLVASLHRFDC